MEAENTYDDVLIKYLLNEASPAEQQFVLAWMAEDENNRLYIEELRKILRLIALKRDSDKINTAQEWAQLREALQLKHAPAFHLEAYTPELQGYKKRNRRMYTIISAAAIAASVILLIGLGNGWFRAIPKPENEISQKAKVRENGAKIDPLMAMVQHEINTSGKVKRLVLSDGSTVVLFDSSELTYKEPVKGDRREVYLAGKADFTVAKDKSKPFTVFSGEISTTAVGTVFMVTAKQNEKWIRVKLNEGKIVVKSLKGYNKRWTKEVYMSPGQELVFDKERRSIKLQSTGSAKLPGNSNTNKPEDNPLIPRYDKRSWFMFNNQSLGEVFNALEEIYGVPIQYSKSEMKNIYFIGTYNKSEPLENVLNQLALLNDLKITKLQNGFKIDKHPVK